MEMSVTLKQEAFLFKLVWHFYPTPIQLKDLISGKYLTRYKKINNKKTKKTVILSFFR